MPNSITFSVPGLPIAQPRHQVARGRAYIPSGHKIHAYKEIINHIANSHMKEYDRKIFDCPLKADLVFMFERPKSHFKKNGDLSKAGKKFPKKTSKGDIDNLQKSVFDSLNGVMYVDDSQICKAVVSKKWGPENITVVKLTPLYVPDDWIGTLD